MISHEHQQPSPRDYRADFPLLRQPMNGKPLTYLDTAATAQKPQSVLDALQTYYREQNANVHRGVYTLAAIATDQYELARKKVARFLRSPSESQIIFTRGTTDALNLVAFGYVLPRVGPGDEIVTTIAEHHSNLVPWQRVAKWKGAKLKFLPQHPDGTIDLAAAARTITPRTRAVSIAHISNVLGTIHPIRQLADLAHEKGSLLIVDAAQSVPHLPVDVTQLDSDFLAFSGHKAYGPTGIGVLYGKQNLLADMEPTQFGGEMIDAVGLYDSSWKDAPWKFEAGTPPIAEAIALGHALDYLTGIGMEQVHQTIRDVTQYAYQRLSALEGITLYGPDPAAERGGVITFNLGTLHPHDVATVLDSEGVAVRAGHHCAQPLMRSLGVNAAVRASFGLYNTREDADKLVDVLRAAKEFFHL
jgi:cysteine desulfurase / selenocysteine lyase